MRKKICISLILCMLVAGLPGCTQYGSPSSDLINDQAENIESRTEEVSEDVVIDFSDLKYESTLETEYACEFSIDYYEDGIVLLTVNEDGSKYLVVPEDKEINVDEKDITIIKRPIENIYLVSSSSMDMFVGIDELDSIKFSGKEADDWYIVEAKDAMNDGKIVYAGKYRTLHQRYKTNYFLYKQTKTKNEKTN